MADIHQSFGKARIVQAGWKDWFKDPVPTRDYGAEDARKDPSSQSLVRDGNILYFIDQGYVFKRDLSGGTPAYLKDSSRVSALLLFKGVLIALRNTGRIYVWTPKQEWVEIGNSAKRILATDKDLVALTENGELWIYQGAPGEIIVSWVLVPMATNVGNTIVTTFITLPMINGHELAFFDSGIKHIRGIEPAEPDDIRVQREDGTASVYSALKISRP